MHGTEALDSVTEQHANRPEPDDRHVASRNVKAVDGV
jgi:hypothetical protein